MIPPPPPATEAIAESLPAMLDAAVPELPSTTGGALPPSTIPSF